MSGKRLVLAALLACALGATHVPSASAAAWIPAIDISKLGRDAVNPSVAMDAAGNTVAIWERQSTSETSHRIQVSTRSVGGAFTDPLDISPNSTEPRLAIAPGGEAVAAWRRFKNPPGIEVIQVATRPPGGSFSAPADVYEAPVDELGKSRGLIPQGVQVAIGPGGAAAVTWTRYDPDSGFDKLICDDGDPETLDFKCPNPYFVEASVRQPGGAFSPPVRVSPPRGTAPEPESPEAKSKREQEESQRTASGPRIGLDGAGNATVVWAYFDGDDRLIQAAGAPPGGGFSNPVAISAPGENVGNPDLGVDASGNAIATWSRPEGVARRVQAALAPPGGAFGPVADLSVAGGQAEAPSVSVSAGGTASVVWRLTGISESFIQSSTRPPGGAFGAVETLSSGNDNPLFPEIAVNDAAAAVATWSGGSGANEVARATVRPAGAFLAPVDISAASTDLFHPANAIDAAGNATAVWSRDNGTHEIIQMAGFDAVPPELRNLAIPSSGTVGVPAPFSVSPFDAWPLAPATFVFGDGASAAGNSVSHTYAAPGTYQVTVSVEDAAGARTTQTGTITIRPKGDFSLGKAKRNKKKGTARLPVTVDGPGAVVLSGKGVRRIRAHASGPGTMNLMIKAAGRKLKRLKRTGSQKLTLKVTFTPDGGSAATKQRKVKLIKTLG